MTDKHLDPNDTEGKSKWAPGENADGTIAIMTPDDAAKSKGERDADEEAFDEMLGHEQSVPVDLESMSTEQLDELIEGLGEA